MRSEDGGSCLGQAPERAGWVSNQNDAAGESAFNRGMDRLEIRFSLISATCRERNVRGVRQEKSTVRDTKVKALELNKGAQL